MFNYGENYFCNLPPSLLFTWIMAEYISGDSESGRCYDIILACKHICIDNNLLSIASLV